MIYGYLSLSFCAQSVSIVSIAGFDVSGLFDTAAALEVVIGVVMGMPMSSQFKGVDHRSMWLHSLANTWYGLGLG